MRDQNPGTVSVIVTRINSPEAARAWAAEKHKQDVKQAYLQGILERIEGRARSNQTSAEFFDEQGKKAQERNRGFDSTIESYMEGYNEAKVQDCLDDARWLDELAKDLRQVLATPTKAI